MSNKPYPVASTAAMLALRMVETSTTWDGKRISIPGTVAPLHTMHGFPARLASTLHRIAPACQRQAIAECNGELFEGQRERFHARMPVECYNRRIHEMETAIKRNGERLAKRLATINKDLEPLSIRAVSGGDPRGWALWLESLDGSDPMPSNGMVDGKWGIA